MTNKLDLSLDEIIVREGISFNDSKRGQKFNNNKSDNKSGFKNITFQINNSKTESNETEEQNYSLKRRIIDDNSKSKRVNNSMSYRSNSSNNADNNGFHFDNNCGAIFVNNLKYEVTDEDIQQLFGAFGVLKRAALNYQSNGRSTGTAFVVFERKCNAIEAFASLKNITLDGRALQLSIVNCNNSNQLSGGLSSMDPKIGDFMGRINMSDSESVSSSGSKGSHIWNDIAKNYDNTYGSNDSKRINYRNRKFNNKNNSNESGSKNNFNVEDLNADLDSYIAERNITK